jgi:hypothetical protein
MQVMQSQVAFDRCTTITYEQTRKSRGLADEAVVLGVVADPEPQNPTLDINAEGAMIKAYSARSKAAHLR